MRLGKDVGRIARRAALAGALAMTLGPPAVALGESAVQREHDQGLSGVEKARERVHARRPTSRFRLPAGTVRVSPAELLAGSTGQSINFTVTLTRDLGAGSLQFLLPRDWVGRARSGIPFAHTPRLTRNAGGRARLLRSGRRVEVALADAKAGDEATLTVKNVGIEAGSYELPLTWRDSFGRATPAGAARVVFYAPEREGPAPNPWARVSERTIANASSDSTEESETWSVVSPVDSDRVAVMGNDIGGSGTKVAFISTNRGQSFVARNIPQSLDAPGTASSESSAYCCDPMGAADNLGNLWLGGLAFGNSGPDRIVVNRIAAGTTTFQAQTTGLPIRDAAGGVDKPLMTIDNSPGSPTYGRLYVVWDEGSPQGNTNVVIQQCDTHPGGFSAAARCDNADNWTAPATVASNGSYIYADVAVAPNGKVFVTYWHYDAANAIEGRVCDPTSANCASSSGWNNVHTVAQLDATGGAAIPFSCPILAQPGGRDAPEPQVAVDTSGGANDGRVYVTWADLRPGSGTTRCTFTTDPTHPDGNPAFDTPKSTHLTWDSFVASAPGAALPGSANPSTTVGTKLLNDATEGGSTTNSDDWFSSIAVDPSNGQAWADFYSTRGDSTRKTTNFYYRSVTPTTPSATTHTLGTLTQASSAASNYSTTPASDCCDFGNDYGDYEGIDAAEGTVYPVWTDNSGGDGEVFTIFSGASLELTHSQTTVAEATGDGDGRIEPGETITIAEQVANPSAINATAVNGTLSTTVPQVTVTQGASAYPDIAAGSSATNTTLYQASLGSSIPCGAAVDFMLSLDTTQSGAGGEKVPFVVQTQCDPPPDGGGGGGAGAGTGTVEGTGTTGAGTTTTPSRTTPPVITLRYNRRQKLGRTGLVLVSPTFDEAVSFTVSGNLATKVKVRRKTRTARYGVRRATGTAAAGREVLIRITLSKAVRRAVNSVLKRRGSAVVKLKLAATDSAGRAARSSPTIRAAK